MSGHKKKPLRGSESFSITIPTEPLASAAKNVPLMAVQVQDDGVKILEYDVKEGRASSFAWAVRRKRSCSAVGFRPLTALACSLIPSAGNKQPVVVDFEHALLQDRSISHAGSWGSVSQ